MCNWYQKINFLNSVHTGLLLLVVTAGCNRDKLFYTDLDSGKFSEGEDTDKDGIADLEELRRGSDPDNADSDGNGIPDGDEDDDADGMSNAWEIKLGYDPRVADSSSKKYPDYAGTPGNDCEKDIDGDGLPNCWEITYGLDPEEKADRDADYDGDGFVSSEEYPDFNPKDPAIFPGAPDFATIYGTSDTAFAFKGKARDLDLKFTISVCQPGEEILISAFPDIGRIDVTLFAACSTEAGAFSAKLPLTLEVYQTCYVFRRVNGQIRKNPVPVNVLFDSTAPGGSVSGTTVTPTSVTFTHTVPTDKDYTNVLLRRFSGSSCAEKLATEGTSVTVSSIHVTSITDSEIKPSRTYCYKFFWYDEIGNEKTYTENVTSPLPPFSLFDATTQKEGKTANTTVKATVSSCVGIDKVLITLDSNPPSASNPGFQTCNTNAFGITATPFSTLVDGTYTIYMWALSDGEVLSQSSTSQMIVDTVPPVATAANFTVTTAASDSIVFGHTKPTDADYFRMVVERHDGTTCSALAAGTGTAVTISDPAVTTITDSGTNPASDYCYRVFWYDDVDNVVSATRVTNTTMPTVTVYDNDLNVTGKTNNVAIRATVASCTGLDEVAFTDTNSSVAAVWIACSTVAYSIAATPFAPLPADGSVNIYFWGRTGGSVKTYNRTVAITVDTTGPSGTMVLSNDPAVMSMEVDKIDIVFDQTPATADFSAMELYHATGPCPTSKAAIDKWLTTANATDYQTKAFNLILTTSPQTYNFGVYTAGSTHCYRVYYVDNLNNESYVEKEFMTKTPAAICTVVSLPTTRTYWYVNSTVSYTFECQDATPAQVVIGSHTEVIPANWPSYLLAANGGTIAFNTPTANLATLTGTAAATGHALKNYDIKFNFDSANLAMTTVLLATTPTFAMDSSITLTDNATVQLNGSAVLAGTYDGTGVGVSSKPLAGTVTAPTVSTNAIFTFTDTTVITDIPRFQFSDSTCTGSAFNICTMNATSWAGTTASTLIDFKWDFNWFDQGRYYLKLTNHVDIEGGHFYSATPHTVRVITTRGETADLAAGVTIDNAKVGHADFTGTSLWFNYNPKISFLQSSTVGAIAAGVIFPTSDSVHYINTGFVSISNGITPAKAQTGFTIDAADRLSSGTGNAIALSSTSFGAEIWTTFGQVTPNPYSGTDAFIQKASDSAGIVKGFVSAINLSNFTAATSLPDRDSQIKSISMTEPFLDSDGETRIGIGFSALFTGTSTQGVYLTKINVDGTDRASLFDTSAWYDTQGANPIDIESGVGIPSMIVSSANGSNAKTLVSVKVVTEGGIPYFYMTWREDIASRVVSVRRILATGVSAVPAVTSLTADFSDFNISGPNGSGNAGRPATSISGGKDTAATPADLTGLLYSLDSINASANSLGCWFQPMKFNNPTYAKLGTPTELETTECRFPHLFYNPHTNDWLAVYFSVSDNDTKMKRFEVDATGAVTLLETVTITNGDNNADFLSATYDSNIHKIGLIKIYINKIGFDIYKTDSL